MDPETAEAVEHLTEAAEHVVEQLQGLEDALAAVPVPVVQPAAGWLLWLLKLFARHGYLLAFTGALAENTIFLGPIVPGGSVVVLSGIAARSGGLSLPLLVVSGAAGMLLGALFNYFLGYIGLGWLPAEGRLGRRVREELDQAGALLQKHGWWAMTVSYVFGPGRSALALAAGASRLPLRRFLAYQAPAALLWSTVYAGGAYLLASEWRRIELLLNRAGWVGTAGIIVAVALWWFIHSQRAKALQIRRKQAQAEAEAVAPPRA